MVVRRATVWRHSRFAMRLGIPLSSGVSDEWGAVYRQAADQGAGRVATACRSACGNPWTAVAQLAPQRLCRPGGAHAWCACVGGIPQLEQPEAQRDQRRLKARDRSCVRTARSRVRPRPRRARQMLDPRCCSSPHVPTRSNISGARSSYLVTNTCRDPAVTPFSFSVAPSRRSTAQGLGLRAMRHCAGTQDRRHG